MDHNVYIGLPNCHVATLLDEELFTYGDPIDVASRGGIMEIALDTDTSTDTIYASDGPWVDSENDNGFTGTIRIANVWGDPVLRKAFADYVGWDFAADGTLLGTSGKPRKSFALMAGASGTNEGKRTCYLKVTAQKPAKNAATKEGNGVHQPDEFPVVCRPVTLPTGWKGSFYENLPSDGELYDNFFSGVRNDLEATDGTNAPIARLDSLAVGTAPLTPAFHPARTSYALTTTSSTLDVTAVPSDPGATVVVKNGTTTISNGGSASLSDGPNTITVTVTNGTGGSAVTKTYTVVVTKTA